VSEKSLKHLPRFQNAMPIMNKFLKFVLISRSSSIQLVKNDFVLHIFHTFKCIKTKFVDPCLISCHTNFHVHSYNGPSDIVKLK
jgi:hypothetical protein